MSESVDIVSIAGSPSADSRSSRVLSALGEHWQKLGLAVRQFGVHDFVAEDLLLARSDAREITVLLDAVRTAKALVLATPVYKAVYSGVLKTMVDLIPPDGLSGKIVFGLATAKIENHAPSVARAYAELFGFFRGSVALPTLYLLDGQLANAPGQLRFDPAIEARVQAAAEALATAIHERR